MYVYNVLVVLSVSGFTPCGGQYFDWDVITSLDDYVHRPDDVYGYDLLYSVEEDGATVYVYNLTSQKWMDEDYIDRPVWWHQLSVVVPDQVTKFDACTLYLTMGDNEEDVIDENHLGLIELTAMTGGVAARLRQVLNEPLYFADDPDVPRTQDQIIARTWKQYIESEEETPNPDMVALLPMTKAAKVAIDAIVEVTNQIDPRFNVDKVMPYGLSKYGWTAWLLACVDPRVFATAPVVFPLLGWHANFHHHYQAYGGWSWAMEPYWTENITMYIDHPRCAEVTDQIAIDPLMYSPRLTIPKLVSFATGDAFFLPDDTHYFFDELLPPKFMTLYENTGHTMTGQYERLNPNLRSFFESTYRGLSWPDVIWERLETDTNGTIELQTDREPLSIRAFWANTTDAVCEINEQEISVCRRDFRGLSGEGLTGTRWAEDSVEDLGNNNFRISYDKLLDDGYRAFFIQMEFEGAGVNQTLDVTTDVHIIPDVLPFPRCASEDECRGTLV